MDVGQSSADNTSAVEDGGTTVEIKIKTLDAQSYTLRVEKNTPVPALKDQIASVVGVPVENQRLICRGKVLKDDQVLSAYNVEDGHTLHLVARQPQPPPPISTGQEAGTGTPGPSDMVIVSPRNRSGHVSHSLLMGTINIPDTGDGGMPDLNRIISAVLSSVGIGNAVPAVQAAAGTGGTVTVGVLPTRPAQATGSDGQQRPGGTDTRVQTGPPPPGFDNGIPRELEATLQIDALYGSSPSGIFNGAGSNAPTPFRIIQQPVVVPDALTTMSQYLDRLEQSFSITEGGTGQNDEGTSVNEGTNHPQTVSGQTSGTQTAQTGPASAPSVFPEGLSVPSSLPASTNDRSDTGVTPGAPTPARRLPTPQALGSIVQRVQTLLSGQAGSALARLATQLENEPSLLDAAARTDVQTAAVRDGHMMQNLGALLLELGRTTLTLRMGQTPAESVVNAGPAVFISPSGPNPMMVQRPPPRAVAGVTSGAPALTVRQVMERAEAANSEHGLTVRQIRGRAEAANAGQQDNAEMNPQGGVAGPVQGAIMTFNENGAMRVVPVRTRPAAGGHGNISASNAANDTNATALLARFQQQLESLQQRAVPQSSGPGASGTNSSTQEPSGSLPSATMPPIRAQVHVQSWAPTFIQALDTGFPQSVVYGPATGEVLLQAQAQNQGAQASTVDAQTGLNVETPSQVLSGSEPTVTTSNEQVENQRGMDAEISRAITDSLVRGPGVSQQDVHEIADSLGPLLNQIVAAFQQPRSPADEPRSDQANVQSSVSQSAGTPDAVSSRASATSTEGSHPSNPQHPPGEGGGQALASDKVEHGGSAGDVHTGVNMDVTDSSGTASGSRPRTSRAEPTLGQKSPEGSMGDGGERPPEMRANLTQETGEDRTGNPPLGLGLGGLQPLPTRGRRRGQGQQRLALSVSPLLAPVTGSGLSAPGRNEQTLAPAAAQSLLQSLVARVDRPSDASDGSAVEQSLGHLTQGLLPLLGNLGSVGATQRAEGSNLGDIMGQLMSRTGEDNAGQAPFPSSMLRGMMGQLVQSPFMENLVQQVMTGARSEETRNPEQALSGHSGGGGFDITGVVQQMLPVISQMFGGTQTPSSGQQVHNSLDVLLHTDEGSAREIPGQTSDTGRWRGALSEEEAAQWSETISADVDQQQCAAPQRPFSDVYARGSPVAKRQKTDLEGTAQKLENGGAPEEVLRSAANNAAEQFVRSNGTAHGEASQLAQHVVETEGLAEAYMAVLFHDLAARVAADPDFGDGTRFPNAARIFQQPKATKEPDGG